MKHKYLFCILGFFEADRASSLCFVFQPMQRSQYQAKQNLSIAYVFSLRKLISTSACMYSKAVFAAKFSTTKSSL